METIERVGVIGAGTMGNGIAQACAVVGLPAVMVDVDETAVARGTRTIAGSLDRLVKKEKLTVDERDAALACVRGSTAYGDLADCDLVIEAATENLELKLKILRQVDALAKPGALIASNTSSISITTLAAVTSRPASFLGVHFFNPVPMMALVELVRGLQTSDATIAAATAFAKRLSKTPIVVKNSPGFVVNRLLCPMLNEAVFALQEGIATAAEIDDVARFRFGDARIVLALDNQHRTAQLVQVGFRRPFHQESSILLRFTQRQGKVRFPGSRNAFQERQQIKGAKHVHSPFP